MTAVANFLAGQRLTAAMLRAIAPNAVMKGDDESISSSTTMQNDDALVIPLVANAGYIIACYFNYEATLGADFKYRFTAPSGITGYQQPTRLNLSSQFTGAFSSLWTDTVTAAGQGASTVCNVFAFGGLVVGPTAGNLQLQWAQNTSNSNQTTVKAGSFLAAWQIQ